jgi:hypothetical protein
MSRLVLSEPHIGTSALLAPLPTFNFLSYASCPFAPALFGPGVRGDGFYPDVITAAARLLVPGAWCETKQPTLWFIRGLLRAF